MAVKAINDSARPNRIIPIFLIFGVYPRMIENSVPLLIITKRTKTIRKTTKEIRCFYTGRQVIDALIIRNNPNIITTLELLIQLDVRVWHETDK
jgi:hypothetical protein